jgi:CheY-like chemotaxis protein
VAAETKPDIVLLDLGLPGMNGCEVARTIRRQSELGAPFLVAVTGWNAPEERLRTKEAGFDEHLTKPVDEFVWAGRRR